MLATMSSRELAEWEEFYAIEREERLQREAAERAQTKLARRGK